MREQPPDLVEANVSRRPDREAATVNEAAATALARSLGFRSTVSHSYGTTALILDCARRRCPEIHMAPLRLAVVERLCEEARVRLDDSDEPVGLRDRSHDATDSVQRLLGVPVQKDRSVLEI